MALTPNAFVSPQTIKTGSAATTTANTTYTDTPTNTVKLFTAGANGSRITRISACPRETVTADQLQVYASVDGGTTKRLINSSLMPATTVDATHAATPVDFGYSDDNPLILMALEELYVGAGLTKSVAWRAEGADY